MRFALLACVLLGGCAADDDTESEGTYLSYDITSPLAFARLEIRLDQRLDIEPIFPESIWSYHYDHMDVFTTYYGEIEIAAFQSHLGSADGQVPAAYATIVPRYTQDGGALDASGGVMLHIAPR